MHKDYDALLPPVVPRKGGGRVAIIGAGIAGMCLAHAFANRGDQWDIHLYDAADGPGQGGSGNALGYLSPRTGREISPALTFHASAWRHALEYYGAMDMLIPRPLVFLADSDRKYQRLEAYANTGLVDGEMLSEADITARCGQAVTATGGLWIADSGMVRPSSLIAGLYARLQGKVTFHFGQAIDDMSGILAKHDLVILASATNMPSWDQPLMLPSSLYRGQISYAAPLSQEIAPILSGNGYLCSTPDLTCFGATFDPINRYARDHLVTEEDHARNVGKLLKTVPDISANLSELSGRASTRAASPDRLPYCGMMPDIAAYMARCKDLHLGQHWQSVPDGKCHDNILVMTCLGARGFSTAPLMAALLVSALSGDDISSRQQEWLRILHPARFLVSDLRRAPVDRRWYGKA